VRTRAWHQVRARIRSLIVIAVLVGLGGGAVLAAAIGARRTETAYPRFVHQIRDGDALVGVGCPPPAVAPCAAVADSLHRQIEHLPEVADFVRTPGMEVLRVDPSGRVDYAVRFLAPNDPRIFRTLYIEKLFAGRYPNPDDPSEIIVNRPLAQARHYHVGQVLSGFRAFPGENRPFKPTEGTPVTLRVAGIAIGDNEVLTDADTPSGLQILATPAMARAHPESTAFNFEQVLLRHGTQDLGSFRAGAQAVLAQFQGLPAIFSNNRSGIPRVQQAIRPQTLALTLFAVVAGVAVLLVVGQALARQTAGEAVDYPALHALGMTRWQLMALPLASAGIVAIGGALLAVAVAVMASPLTPIGYGKIAEPHPGLSINAAWLLVGALLLVIAVFAVALPPAWFATRDLVAGSRRGSLRERPSWVAERLARMGAPAPPVVGAQLALERGRGRTAVPARTAIAGAAASITVVALVLTFSAGLNRVVGSRYRYGQNWDAVVDNDFYPLPIGAVSGAFPAAGVRDYAAGNFGDVIARGQTVPAMGLDAPASPGGRQSYLTVLEGRAAAAGDEIALGPKTMRQLHAHLGQSLAVTVGPATRTMRVVGRVVFPASPVGTTLRVELGDGAQVVAAVLAAPAPPGSPPGSLYTFFPVRFGPGDRASQLTSLRQGVDPGGACPLGPCVITKQQPATVRSYGSALRVQYVLVAFVALLAVAAVAYTVGASIRRRRRDFAILEAMGLMTRQLYQTITWQAMTMALIALVVGVPLGVALGRVGWRAFAEGLGVGPDAVVPGGPLAVGAAIAVAVTAAIAAFFFGSLRRTKPALVLRTE
jgi:hypothetical protein